MKTVKKEKIGQFLIRNNYISRKQYKNVINRQKKNPGKKFGAISIELGYINENAINEYIKYFFDGEYIFFTEKKIKNETIMSLNAV